MQSTQRESFHHLLAVSEMTQGKLRNGHTSLGWHQNHLVEGAMEETVREAMVKGEAGNQPVRTTLMEMYGPTRLTLSSSRLNLKMLYLTLAQ